MNVGRKLAWTFLIGTLVVFTTAGTAGASTSHVSNSQSCGKSTVMDHLSSARALTPSEILPLPDGGDDYVYYINEYKNEFLVPPVGFNPLNATDAQLKEYGIQPRPTDNLIQLHQWEMEMSHWKKTPIPNVLMIPGVDHRRHQQSIISSSTDYNGNWSGYENLVSTNTFIGIQGDFVQPTPASTLCSGANESAWAGIGGSNTSSLIQAGTDMNFGGTPFAWYEWVGPNNTGVSEQPLPQLNVRAGDNMHVYVSYQTSTGEADFYVADNTNGTSQSVVITLSSSFYDGTSAEWVDEAPTNSSTHLVEPLENYQQDAWTNAQTYNTSGVWNSVTTYTYDKLFITDNGNSTGNIESASSDLTTSTSWTDYWHRCN